jgi:hypothetical protein
MRNTQSSKYSTADNFLPRDKFLPARKFLSLFFCALAFALCASPTLLAQTSATTSIGGRITDAQGAGVAGAIVTLYARAPQQQRLTATTDANGAYRFESLAAGEYLIEADARA